eukprot:505688_1
MSIIFIKIEVLNTLYNYNKNISNKTLYHGLDRLFNTKGLGGQFYGALSTTYDQVVAGNFAGYSGMILQINTQINKENINAIDIDWISECNEKEVLLMNPKVIIQKSLIFADNIQIKVEYLKQ